MVSHSSFSSALACLLTTVLMVGGCATSPATDEDSSPSLGPGIRLTGVDAPDRLLVPAISGVIRREDVAVADARVLIARNQGVDSRCEEALAEVLTNADGEFVFDAITAKLEIGKVIKKLDTSWQVCVTENNAADGNETDAKLIWYDQHTGVLFNREPTRLLCDLGASGTRAKRFTGDTADLACRSTTAVNGSQIQLDSIN